MWHGGAEGPTWLALVAAGLMLALVGVIDARAALPTALLLYLVPIILAATRWGRGPAALAVLIAILGHDRLFAEPVGTLRIARADEAVGLALLLRRTATRHQTASTTPNG